MLKQPYFKGTNNLVFYSTLIIISSEAKVNNRSKKVSKSVDSNVPTAWLEQRDSLSGQQEE